MNSPFEKTCRFWSRQLRFAVLCWPRSISAIIDQDTYSDCHETW